MEMLKGIPNSPVKTLVWVTAALVLVALLGTLVVTQLNAHGGGNTDVVHLCVDDNNGEVEVIGPAGTCSAGSSPIDIQALALPAVISGAAIDAMTHPMSPEMTARLAGVGFSGADELIALS